MIVVPFGKKPSSPLAVRAFDDLRKHYHHGTEIGRFLLGMAEKEAFKAQERAKKRDRREAMPDEKKEYIKAWDAADEAYSLFIRFRDTTGPVDPLAYRKGYCCTCKKLKNYHELQCGHWKRRKHYGPRWHEQNGHAQCAGCNSPKFGGGMENKHEEHIVTIHGAAVRDEIARLVKTRPEEPPIEELREIKKYYTEKLEDLKLAQS